MKKYLIAERGFHWTNKAWYWDALKKENPEIMFGIYPEGGGTKGEITMRWIDIDIEQVPRLECFSDTLPLLHNTFLDVLRKLAALNGKRFTQNEFVAILKDCGFRDMTKYTQESS